MYSNDDLFASRCSTISIDTDSSIEYSVKHNKSIKNKNKNPVTKESHPIKEVVELLQDFSSYEKHELLVETDSSNLPSNLYEKLSIGENNPKSLSNNNSGKDSLQIQNVKLSDHIQPTSVPKTLCSTPGPFASHFYSNNAHKINFDHSPTEFLFKTVQCTPIRFPESYNQIQYKLNESRDIISNSANDSTFSSNKSQCVQDKCSYSNTNQIDIHFADDSGNNNNDNKKKSITEIGKKSSAFIKRLTRHFRIDNILLNRSYLTLYKAGDLKGTLLKISEQSNYKTFAQLFTPFRRKSLRKIGEGCFGEVFSCSAQTDVKSSLQNPNSENVVIKLIPVEGNVKFNGEIQKSFGEALSEVIVSKELSALTMGFTNRTSSFVELKSIHLLQGSFPSYLKKAWEQYDEEKHSENDNPNIFPKTQIWVALESAYCGSTLEHNLPPCPASRLSIIEQVCLALTVAELELKFEHRDLHWGNVLVQNMIQNNSSTSNQCDYCFTTTYAKTTTNTPTSTKTVNYRVDNLEYHVPTFGIIVSIIDFTLSRLEQDDGLVYVDLSADPTLFESYGDYQFDIYRKMRLANGDNWKEFNPQTNVMWIHYLLTKLCCEKSQLSNDFRIHNSLLTNTINNTTTTNTSSSFCSNCPEKNHEYYWEQLNRLEKDISLSKYKSALDLIQNHEIFKLLCSSSN